MGSLTGTQLTDAVIQGIGGRTDVDPGTTALRWVNWTYQHIARPEVFRHNELQTQDDFTLTTSVIYTLTNVRWLNHVVYVRGASSSDYSLARQRLRVTTLRELERGQFPEGEPTRYARWGNSLYLNVRPNTTAQGNLMVVRGWKRPADLTMSTASVIDEAFDEVLVLGGIWRAWREHRNHDDALAAKTEFLDMLRELREPRFIDGEDEGEFIDPDNDPYQPNSVVGGI